MQDYYSYEKDRRRKGAERGAERGEELWAEKTSGIWGPIPKYYKTTIEGPEESTGKQCGAVTQRVH